MQEQRRGIRTASSALVEIWHPSLGQLQLKARDLSDGGVFVLKAHGPMPPVGTVLQVRIKRHTGVLNQEPVAMKVIHQQADGFGLMFI